MVDWIIRYGEAGLYGPLLVVMGMCIVGAVWCFIPLEKS